MKATHIIEQFADRGAFFPVFQEPLVTASGRQVPDRVANVRGDTGEIMGIVSRGYKVIPYEEGVVVPAARALEESGLDLSGAEVDVKFAKGGGRMVGVITLPNEKMLVNGTDEHLLQVLLRSGHDADFFVDFRPGAVRMACFNGNFIVDSIGAFKAKHTSGFAPELLREQARHLLGSFKQAGERWSEWSRRPLTDDQAARVLGIYCHVSKENLNRGAKGVEEQKEKRETKLTRLFDRYVTRERKEIGATAFGVYNTMTWDATHGKLAEGKEATSMVLRHADVTRTINDRYWTTQLKLAA